MMVRGISLISIGRYVKSSIGDDTGLRQFYSRFPKGEPEIILSAEKGKWYPFRLQRHLREEVVAEFNPDNPDLAINDMVPVTANYEISAFLRAIIGHLPTRLVLRQITRLWDKMYRPGKMTLVEGSDTHAVIDVTEFDHDRLFCPTMTAWLQVAAQNMGIINPEVNELKCIHRGDELCRWEIVGR